jgi:thioredoxin
MIRSFDTPIFTNDQSIDRVLAADIPVLLVFLPEQPAADLNRALDGLAKKHAGQLLVAKVQARDNPQSVRRFNAEQSPALVAWRKGEQLSTAQRISAPDLEAHAAYVLGRGPKPTPQPAAAGHAPAGDRSRQGPGQATGRPAAGEPGVSQPAGDGRPVHATDQTFDQEVLRSRLPVVVDFWAPWCGPCRMTDPILEKLAREWAGRVRVVKVNADENPATIGRYGVQGIPTMLVVQDGRIVDRWVGALPEQAMRSRLMSALNLHG